MGLFELTTNEGWALAGVANFGGADEADLRAGTGGATELPTRRERSSPGPPGTRYASAGETSGIGGRGYTPTALIEARVLAEGGGESNSGKHMQWRATLCRLASRQVFVLAGGNETPNSGGLLAWGPSGGSRVLVVVGSPHGLHLASVGY